MDKQEAYKILGILENTEVEYIRRRYRELMKRHHPDVTGSSSSSLVKVQEVTEAYRFLKSEGYLHPGEAEHDWGIRENRRVFTKRTIFMEEDLFGSDITIDTGIRGKYYWDPEIESFQMLLKSVGQEGVHILTPFWDKLVDGRRQTQVQAKLLHLLLQEFIDPYETLRLLYQTSEGKGENIRFCIPCHLKPESKDLSSIKAGLDFSVVAKGSILSIASSDGFAGTISFQESFMHYVATPLVIQGAAKAVFVMKDIFQRTKGRKDYINGELILYVNGNRKQDQTEKINAEIYRMLSKIR